MIAHMNYNDPIDKKCYIMNHSYYRLTSLPLIVRIKTTRLPKRCLSRLALAFAQGISSITRLTNLLPLFL